MTAATADICDDNEALIREGKVAALAGDWRWYGQTRAFSGPLSTVATAGFNQEIVMLFQSQAPVGCFLSTLRAKRVLALART